MKENLTKEHVVACWLQLLRKLCLATLVLGVSFILIKTASAQTKLVGLATEGGAFAGGTMFSINLDGSELKTLYDFESSEGSAPFGTLIQKNEWLYGVSKSGGDFGFGTIFRIDTTGSDHSVLFHFNDQTGNAAGSLLLTRENILFGVTIHNEAGYGTIYKINPDGTGYQEVYRFNVINQELQPGFVMQAANGTIYGTTYSGGGYGFGHAFRLNPDGSNPTVLIHFSWEDGEYLEGGLIQGNDGALYGTTAYDGMVYGQGVLYRLVPDAAVVNVIHHFNSGEGNHPGGNLVQAPDNTLYGMTLEGGQYNNGALYSLSADSADFAVLENFDGDNGKGSANNMVYFDNQLYGYTTTGGLHDGGVVFTYDLSTGSYSKIADLNDTSGTHPMLGGLLLLKPAPAQAPTLAASNISFSNVTSHSMTLTFTPGDGISRLVVTKSGSPTSFLPQDDSLYIGSLPDGATVLYNGPKTSFEVTGLTPDTAHYFAIFEYNTNYAGDISYLNNSAAVADHSTLPYSEAKTKFVGVTRFGGRYDAGTMFSMEPDGSDFTVLHNFDGWTGSHQVGKFLIGNDGYLYGVSRSGGDYATGTLYKIRPDGTHHTVIHNFTREEGYPTSPPVQIEDSTFIGVSLHDEEHYGIVYQMNPDGTDYIEIYRFNAPLGFRQPGYIMQASAGYLFVTTYAGGDSNNGMILRLNADGTNPLLVHSFDGSDGVFPYSRLTEGIDSTLYGVAHLAGPNGAGVVYRINSDGSGFEIIHGFNGSDGAFPSGAVTQDEDGTLYGMTIIGGIDDRGVLYKMDSDGSDFQVLKYLTEETGQGPAWDLLLYDNKLYGLTSNGGAPETPGKAWSGGTAFYFDLTTNEFHKLHDLTPRTGIAPYMGGLIQIGQDDVVQGVRDFSLINTRTEEVIETFEESVTIDEGHPDFADWTIKANTYPEEVGSVIFNIDNEEKNTENREPYLLQRRFLRTLSLTPHILIAEAFTGRQGSGATLQSRTAVISFDNNTAVTAFGIVNVAGDTIRELEDGDVLNIQDSALRYFNIAAILNRNSRKASVQFYLNGEFYHNENQAPYMLAMSNRRWWNEPGIYTVSAVPYSRKNGSGLPGTPLTVTFFIEDKTVITSPLVKSTDENGRIEIFPVPALGQLNISIQGASTDKPAHIVIWDMMGGIRFDAHIPATQVPFIVDLERAGLQKGMHFIRIERESTSEVLRFVKE